MPHRTIWKPAINRSVNSKSIFIQRRPASSNFFFISRKKNSEDDSIDRIDDPEKIGNSARTDIKERKFWNGYMEAYENCIGSTNTTGCTMVHRSRRRQR